MPLTRYGSGVTAWCEVNTGEHQRRARCGLGAVTDLALLDCLMNFPCDVVVPLPSVSPRSARILGRSGQDVARMDSESVVRVLDMPLTVHRIEIEAGRCAATAVRRAYQFGQYATRWVLLQPGQPITAETLAEADFHGVGVAVAATDATEAVGGWQVLVAATPFTVSRYSAARWEFAELAYGSLLVADLMPVERTVDETLPR